MNREKSDQYQQFAKDWSRGIRAQQVIPIYPLRTDLSVGDVYLVERPIENEAELYDQTGFLPLGRWLDKIPVKTELKPYKSAFATFNSNISRGGSIGAGIPVSGVPVAFGLLGSDTATASVALHDASTEAVADLEMDRWLTKWAADKKDVLKPFGPAYARDKDGLYWMRYNYLRVITRVYRVGEVAVTMNDASTRGGRAQAGVSANLNLIPATGTVAENITNIVNAVNEPIAATTLPSSGPSKTESKRRKTKKPAAEEPAASQPAASQPAASQPAASQPATGPNGPPSEGKDDPQDIETPAVGVNAKFFLVTNRGVSMNEKFPEPMVVGYVAIDVPIAADGSVGYHPVETDVRLRRRNRAEVRYIVNNWINDHPHARDILEPWVVLNEKYLIERGLLTPGLRENWRKAADVARRIENPPLWKVVFPGKNLAIVSSRILTEVIERPEGLGPIENESKILLDRERGYDTASQRNAQ